MNSTQNQNENPIEKILTTMSRMASTALRGHIVFVGTILVVFFSILDYMIGIEVDFSIFYLAPISLVAWFGTRRWSVFLSIISAVMWDLNDLWGGHQYSHPAIPIWNGALRWFFFMIVILLLTRLKRARSLDIHMATTDSLTEVGNARLFYQQLEKEKSRAIRHKHPLSLCYVDLDNFKQVNDEYGHSVGDLLLRNVAACMRGNLRTSDTVARLGGDEFGIILPETDRMDSKSVVGKMERELLKAMNRNKWPVTFSIGVVTFDRFPDSADEMIRAVDEQMYVAKNSGKNQAAFAEYG